MTDRPPARGIAGDARAVDTAADDEEVAVRRGLAAHYQRRGPTDELRDFCTKLAFNNQRCSSWSTLTREPRAALGLLARLRLLLHALEGPAHVGVEARLVTERGIEDMFHAVSLLR